MMLQSLQLQPIRWLFLKALCTLLATITIAPQAIGSWLLNHQPVYGVTANFGTFDTSKTEQAPVLRQLSNDEETELINLDVDYQVYGVELIDGYRSILKDAQTGETLQDLTNVDLAQSIPQPQIKVSAQQAFAIIKQSYPSFYAQDGIPKPILKAMKKDTGNIRLVYEFHLENTYEGHSDVVAPIVRVDAISGEIADVQSDVMFAYIDVTGEGGTRVTGKHYYGAKPQGSMSVKPVRPHLKARKSVYGVCDFTVPVPSHDITISVKKKGSGMSPLTNYTFLCLHGSKNAYINENITPYNDAYYYTLKTLELFKAKFRHRMLNKNVGLNGQHLSIEFKDIPQDAHAAWYKTQKKLVINTRDQDKYYIGNTIEVISHELYHAYAFRVSNMTHAPTSQAAVVHEAIAYIFGSYMEQLMYFPSPYDDYSKMEHIMDFDETITKTETTGLGFPKPSLSPYKHADLFDHDEPVKSLYEDYMDARDTNQLDIPHSYRHLMTKPFFIMAMDGRVPTFGTKNLPGNWNFYKASKVHKVALDRFFRGSLTIMDAACGVYKSAKRLNRPITNPRLGQYPPNAIVEAYKEIGLDLLSDDSNCDEAKEDQEDNSGGSSTNGGSANVTEPWDPNDPSGYNSSWAHSTSNGGGTGNTSGNHSSGASTGGSSWWYPPNYGAIGGPVSAGGTAGCGSRLLVALASAIGQSAAWDLYMAICPVA